MMKFNNTISVTPIVRFRTHKEKESMSGCQDYYNYNLDNNCFAIADGATQSFYPSIWAQLLVNSFCRNPEVDQENWQQWLQPIQKNWLETVKKQVEKAKNDHNPVWIDNQNRLNRFESATSTFIGLQFIENQAKISLVGDSCLFIFQDNKLLKSYLLENSAEFGYRPEYFASYRKNNDFAPKFLDIDLKYDKFSKKLYFILATDALAEYIFEHIESEKQQDMFNTLLELSSQEEFDDFVASARNNTPIKMKNDDVTLVILEVNNCKISSFPTEIKKGKLEKSGLATIPISEDKIDSAQGVGDEPEHPDISLHPSKEMLQENPNSGELQDQINSSSSNSSTTMVRKNSGRVSPSRHQQKKDKPPVIKGLDGIRNLLLVFVPISLVLSATTLYFTFRLFNKISGEQLNQLITQNQQMVQKTTFEPKYVKLDKGEDIYQDQNFQQITIPNLSNSSQGLILEEGENWIKFEVDIYAYESIVNSSCNDCGNNEIEIQPAQNLRTFPSQSEEDIFGELTESSKFKKLDFNSLPQWYKVKFVGYVKK